MKQKERINMFCSNCGKEIDNKAVICVHCGCAVNNPIGSNDRSWIVTLLLCFFLGVIGAHRFYTGHITSGVLQLLTLGGLGIWAFIDFIVILCGGFRTKNGQSLVR